MQIEPSELPEKMQSRPVPQPSYRTEVAWAVDLVQSITGKGQFDVKDLVVAKEELLSFLESETTSKLIVSGARGMGKSIALAYKMAKLQSSPSFQLIPDVFPFVHRLPKLAIPLTATQLYDTSNAKVWRNIWLVAVGIFLAAQIRKTNRRTLQNEEFPSWAIELVREANKRSVSRDEPFSSIVQKVIALSGNDLNGLYTNNISSIISERASGIKIAICVDAIDEAVCYFPAKQGAQAVSLFSRQPDIEFTKGGDSRIEPFAPLAKMVWISAQRGYAGAAAHIATQTSYEVRVYGSLRSEARRDLATAFDDTESKWKAFIEDLSVHETDYESIFSANVARSDESRLPSPNSALAAERLTGLSRIPSRVVSEEFESVLGCIMRHTFQTPRGMVAIGGSIYANLPHGVSKVQVTDKQKIDRVLNLVNTCSQTMVLEEHLSQLMPLLDESLISFATETLPHNILSPKEMREFNTGYSSRTKNGSTTALDMLYSAGLVGIPREINGKWIQVFLGYDEIGHASKIPTNTSYCVVHPALSARRSAQTRTDYYRSAFLVGQELVCPQYFYPAAVTVRLIHKVVREQLTAEFGFSAGSAVFDRPFNVVGYGFLFGLLFAIRHTKSPTVNSNDICKQIKILRREGWLASRFGTTQQYAEIYYQDLLKGISPSTMKGDVAAIRTITQWFNDRTKGEWRIHAEDQDDGVVLFSLQNSLGKNSNSEAKLDFGDTEYLDLEIQPRTTIQD